jgi:hypothetical protein
MIPCSGSTPNCQGANGHFAPTRMHVPGMHGHGTDKDARPRQGCTAAALQSMPFPGVCPFGLWVFRGGGGWGMGGRGARIYNCSLCFGPQGSGLCSGLSKACSARLRTDLPQSCAMELPTALIQGLWFFLIMITPSNRCQHRTWLSRPTPHGPRRKLGNRAGPNNRFLNSPS